MLEKMSLSVNACWGINSDLIPQLLAERRGGGAGIPAFFTPAGYGTEVGGKEVEYLMVVYILETALEADFSFCKSLERR